MTLDYKLIARDLLLEQEGSEAIGDYVDTVQVDSVNFDVRFNCQMRGYAGWVWTVSFSQPEKRKTALVSEVHLMAGADAVLAPAWVPWAERLAEFRKQLKLEGKAQTDDEADALIANMAGALLDDSAVPNHEETDETQQDSEAGGGKPPAKVRVRQRRIKRAHDSEGEQPAADADPSNDVGSDG